MYERLRVTGKKKKEQNALIPNSAYYPFGRFGSVRGLGGKLGPSSSFTTGFKVKEKVLPEE